MQEVAFSLIYKEGLYAIHGRKPVQRREMR